MRKPKSNFIFSFGLALASIAFAPLSRALEASTVCDLINNPTSHANKHVVVRGAVYIGMENGNISDENCPGHPIQMDIAADLDRHKDIRDFLEKLGRWKMHGHAIIAGTFIVRDDPLAPYLLKVKKVLNVESSTGVDARNE